LGFLERVNRTAVSPKLLGEAMELWANMAPEDRPALEARAFRLFEFLKNKGSAGRRHSDLALAINFRPIALARLVHGDHVKGWTLADREEGVTLLHADVLRAAAKEVLIEDPDNAIAFEANSFVRRVLHVAQPRGRA
jgi:hypothetical protein